jgi:Ca2+-binding EF-hand superfamily protein
MDQRGDHKLDVDDFRWGLLDFGIQVTKEEAQELLNRFDADKNGTVNFDEFMSAIKVSKRQI